MLIRAHTNHSAYTRSRGPAAKPGVWITARNANTNPVNSGGLRHLPQSRWRAREPAAHVLVAGLGLSRPDAGPHLGRGPAHRRLPNLATHKSPRFLRSPIPKPPPRPP